MAPRMESGSSKGSGNMSPGLPDTVPFTLLHQKEGQTSKKVHLTLLGEYFSSNLRGIEKVP